MHCQCVLATDQQLKHNVRHSVDFIGSYYLNVGECDHIDMIMTVFLCYSFQASDRHKRRLIYPPELAGEATTILE